MKQILETVLFILILSVNVQIIYIMHTCQLIPTG